MTGTDSTIATVPADAFTAAMRLVPMPVALVAVAHDGQRQGLAVTAWTSLSTAPPTLLVCINRAASAHDAIIAAGAFSLSLADQAHREAVAIFSRQRGLMGDDRFLAGCWRPGPSGQPLLVDAVAAFECAVLRVEDGETHSIVIGAVTHVATETDRSALIYRDGGFGRLETAEAAA